MHGGLLFVFLIQYGEIDHSAVDGLKSGAKSPLINVYRLIMAMHGVCMICHLCNKGLKYCMKESWDITRVYFQLTKMMIYFFGILFAQSRTISALYDEKKGYTMPRNYIETLLVYDISFFYFTIFALMIFNATIRCRRFHTLRERYVGSVERFKYLRGDALYFAREDIFWFTITWTRILLFLMIELNNV